MKGSEMTIGRRSKAWEGCEGEELSRQRKELILRTWYLKETGVSENKKTMLMSLQQSEWQGEGAHTGRSPSKTFGLATMEDRMSGGGCGEFTGQSGGLTSPTRAWDLSLSVLLPLHVQSLVSAPVCLILLSNGEQNGKLEFIWNAGEKQEQVALQSLGLSPAYKVKMSHQVRSVFETRG